MKNFIKILFLSFISTFSFAQNVGIGTQIPTNKLHVVDVNDPLRLEGLNSFISSDSAILITTSDSGVIRYITIDDLIVKLGGVNTDKQNLYVNGDSVCITNGNCINIKDMVDSMESLTVLNLVSNRYLTYLDENGTTKTIDLRTAIRSNESLTVLNLVSNRYLTYLDENGTTKTIDLRTLVTNNESLTVLNLVSNRYLTYLDENGNTKTIDLRTLVSTNETLTTIVQKDSNIVYYDEDGDSSFINIKSFVDNYGSDNQTLNFGRYYFKEDTLEIIRGNKVDLPMWWQQNTDLSIRPKYSYLTNLWGANNYKSFMLGDSNGINSKHSFIGTATNSNIDYDNGFIGAGVDNKIFVKGGVILNGIANEVTNAGGHSFNKPSLILNGQQNLINEYDLIGFNTIINSRRGQINGGVYSLLGSVDSCLIQLSTYSQILSGNVNIIKPSSPLLTFVDFTTILNGRYNETEGKFSLILNGENNEIKATGTQLANPFYSTIINGNDNTINAPYAMAQGEGNNARTFHEIKFGRFAANKTPVSSSYSSYNWYGSDQLFVIGNGSSNINRSNAFEVLKNGNAYVNGTIAVTSDSTLKTNIIPLTSSLSKLSLLNGYSYNWIDVEHRGDERQIGLLSQQVERVFPELAIRNNGILTLNYQGLIPVVIEAMKEQQSIIQKEKEKNEELQYRVEKLEQLMEELLKSKQDEK